MIFIIILAILLVIIDQISKYVMAGYINIDIPIIKNILHFIYSKDTQNRGAAFGLLPGARWFFIIITIIFCLIIIRWLIKLPKIHIILKIASAFVLGGAIGNFIDRLFLGHVRDFIEFKFLKNFAICNVADCCVVVGTILLCFYLLFIHEKYLVIEKSKYNEQP